ncbi:SDR family oxidoreductase [Methylococcus geothermalis]|uniref:SDR family NAD(P)-dependent oxidoreductase n=1 Tax=Methylococcus geothermalis TaxID=2681310 RepID=A0A858Q6I2_9GAMM|nr:SDR family oxidoreductase [Methylococcus geothermalis]QJD29492.1 SDR family NAD(P)-dependent oxidoreductase [Methylococcus geothermalis]
MLSVLVTGANRGLGLEFTRQYLDAGWRVIATCRHPHDAPELRDLAKRHEHLAIHALDVRTFTSIDQFASALAGQPLDVLINNAGVYGDEPGNGFGAIDYELWQDVLRTNAMAPVKMAESFLPHLERGSRKLIVGITSLMGSMGDNTSGGALYYRSSKAALNATFKSLSLDLKPRGIGVLLLNPGWVQTDMGGPQAPTTAERSVGGMRRIIAEYTPALSGRLMNFDGRELPW